MCSLSNLDIMGGVTMVGQGSVGPNGEYLCNSLSRCFFFLVWAEFYAAMVTLLEIPAPVSLNLAYVWLRKLKLLQYRHIYFP